MEGQANEGDEEAEACHQPLAKQCEPLSTPARDEELVCRRGSRTQGLTEVVEAGSRPEGDEIITQWWLKTCASADNVERCVYCVVWELWLCSSLTWPGVPVLKLTQVSKYKCTKEYEIASSMEMGKIIL